MRGLVFAAAIVPMLAAVLAQPFVGVILWCWISFMNPHKLIWGFAADAPWALLVALATVAGLVLSRERKTLPVNPTTVLIGLFLVCITLTSLVAQAPAEAVFAKWNLVFKSFAFLLVIAMLTNTRRRIEAVIWIIVFSIGYYGVRGGAFALMTAGEYRVYGPEGTMIGDNNQLAAAILVVMPLMNYLRMQSRHRVVRLALAAGMALCLIAVLASYSRGALLGLGAAVLALWWHSRRKVIGGAVLALGLAAGISLMPAQWSDRMHTIETYQEDGSANERFAIWTVATEMAMARPLTGAGFMAPYIQSVVSAYDPTAQARAVHSIWFETLGEHGFPTFFVWLGLSVAGLVNTARVVRRTRGRPELRWAHDLARMVQVSMVAYLTAGTFLSLCYWDTYFTILVAMSATHAQVVAALSRRSVVAPRVRGALAWTG